MLPVSALPVDGTYPTGTSQYEKRNLATEIPVWDPNVCIQCGKCAMVCPHGVIRIKVYDEEASRARPPRSGRPTPETSEWQRQKYTIQVSPEDCTGCGICVDVCPAKNKSEARLKAINMQPQAPLREQEKRKLELLRGLARDGPPARSNESSIRQQQVQQPLFEFSGACSGCGETPYIKLLTQLFGDRLVVANATGCSSIYGGNLPTTPWAHNRRRARSRLEQLALRGQRRVRPRLSAYRSTSSGTSHVSYSRSLSTQVGDELAAAILDADQHDETGIQAQRERVAELKTRLAGLADPTNNRQSGDAQRLLQLADMLVRKSVWIIGGDGWAYDIGFGGLDHVLSSGRNVKVLVLDTEVYSNTGGQMSKSTPRGSGRQVRGGRQARAQEGPRPDRHDLRQHLRGERGDGRKGRAYPQGLPGGRGIRRTRPHHRLQPLHRTRHRHGDRACRTRKRPSRAASGSSTATTPTLKQQGENPLVLDSRAPRIPVEQYMYMENRFKMLYQEPARKRPNSSSRRPSTT